MSAIRRSTKMWDAVAGLAARELTPRLLHGGLVRPLSVPRLPVNRLATRVLVEDLDGALDVVARAQRAGMSLREAYEELIPEAASQLGRWWDDDRVRFVDVEIALTCLERVIRRLRPTTVADRGHVLLTSLPGQEHTLAMVILGASLRADGWEVQEHRGLGPRQIAAQIGEDTFDCVGISGSDDGALEPADIELIHDSAQIPLVILVGGGSWERYATLGVQWCTTIAQARQRLVRCVRDRRAPRLVDAS